MSEADDDVGLRARLAKRPAPDDVHTLVPDHRLDAGHVLHADRYWKPKFWRKTQPGTVDHQRLFADIRPNQRTPERNALSRFILNFKRGYESLGLDVDIQELVRAVNIAFPAAECSFDLALQAVHSKKSRTMPGVRGSDPSTPPTPQPTMPAPDNSAMHALLAVVRDDLERRGRDPAEAAGPGATIEFTITGERYH